MKRITSSLVLLSVLFVIPAVYGQAPKGVAGVNVVVKQKPTTRAVTDAGGNFSLEGLPAGSYTLAFHPQKAKDIKTASTTQTVVATSYSIKVQGTKRPISQSDLTSDKLLAGIQIQVEVGAGARVRGQVLAEGLKKMVWIAGEIGSHIPGHWAAADSPEAKARRNNSQVLSRDEIADSMSRGNANRTDPVDPRGGNAPGSGGAPRS